MKAWSALEGLRPPQTGAWHQEGPVSSLLH